MSAFLELLRHVGLDKRCVYLCELAIAEEGNQVALDDCLIRGKCGCLDLWLGIDPKPLVIYNFKRSFGFEEVQPAQMIQAMIFPTKMS